MSVRITKRDRAVAKFFADKTFRKQVLAAAKKQGVGVGINPDNIAALLKILSELLPFILALFGG